MYDKVSNRASKLIKSLQQKKYRDAHRLFVVEGPKVVSEALSAKWPVSYIVFTGSADDLGFDLPPSALQASERELSSMSSLKHPNRILAVCQMKEEAPPLPDQGPLFALDQVADPGNLGTIIRLCDWFGMGHLICSPATVDTYNPKAVQATMGSIFRVAIHRMPLPEFLQNLPEGRTAYAADMEGKSIYETDFGTNPIVVLGSEAHGLGPEVRDAARLVGIPKYGQGESLNVAISAAVIAAELRR